MSESALIRAVRDRIRAHTAYTSAEVNVELDEEAPPTVGNTYILVIPAGIEPGPRTYTNQQAHDHYYNVDVAVAIRAPMLPRDRRRDLFVAAASGFEVHLRQVNTQIDFQYEVNDVANLYILSEETTSEGFIEPLRFTNADRFRLAPSELFAARSGEEVAAIIRTYHYRRARRKFTRS